MTNMQALLLALLEHGVATPDEQGLAAERIRALEIELERLRDRLGNTPGAGRFDPA